MSPCASCCRPACSASQTSCCCWGPLWTLSTRSLHQAAARKPLRRCSPLRCGHVVTIYIHMIVCQQADPAAAAGLPPQLACCDRAVRARCMCHRCKGNADGHAASAAGPDPSETALHGALDPGGAAALHTGRAPRCRLSTACIPASWCAASLQRATELLWHVRPSSGSGWDADSACQRRTIRPAL